MIARGVSPKLDKACIDGDSKELDEGQTSRFRSSVLTLLRCVTTMTGENNWSRDWKSSQILTGPVIRRHGRARVVRRSWQKA